MTAQTGRAPLAPPAARRGGPLVQYALLAGPLLSMLDSSIVNVAVEPIARELHASLTVVQWTVSGYLLALGAGLAATAYLARRFGTLAVYRVSVIAFTAASALCALAPDAGVLVGARIVQGLVAAPLVPLAMSMLLGRDTGGARAISPVAGILLFLGPALGPTVGGALIGAAGWRAIFLINVPLGVLAAVAVRYVPAAMAPERRPGARFDLPGLILLAAGRLGDPPGSRCGSPYWPASPCSPWLLLITAATPLWLIAVILAGRSVAVGPVAALHAAGLVLVAIAAVGALGALGLPAVRNTALVRSLTPPGDAALLGHVRGRGGDRGRVRAEVLQVLVHPQQVRVMGGGDDPDHVPGLRQPVRVAAPGQHRHPAVLAVPGGP